MLIENSLTPALEFPEAPDPELELELDDDEPVEEPVELPVSEDKDPKAPVPEEPVFID